MILHIPHNSTWIPSEFESLFIASADEIAHDLLRMTDRYTSDLFNAANSQKILFPYSRLLVDVERFPDDDMEPMSNVGMGMIYTKTSLGKPLKQRLTKAQRARLQALYTYHHQQLTVAVTDELEALGATLIIDCHSYPSQPLNCEQVQVTPRAEICIGTDRYHTADALVDTLSTAFHNKGYSVQVNLPYSGTLVPMAYYQKDKRVSSVMIEINRALYMDEQTGLKSANFDNLQRDISTMLTHLQQQFYGERHENRL